MTAATCGAVQADIARLRVEQFKNLRGQHGDVACFVAGRRLVLHANVYIKAHRALGAARAKVVYNAAMNSSAVPVFHATTILCVRRGETVAIGGDGQVTMQNIVAKGDAVKVRRLDDFGADKAGVLIGFAGAAADAFALLDKFETKLKETPENIKKAAIELAKLWRTDRALRQLESLLVVADRSCSLLVSGSGDVIEPSDGIVGIGSGGSYATAAARALVEHTEQAPEDVVRSAMHIAGELCIYTNTHITVLTL